jgi:hypothetical protein
MEECIVSCTQQEYGITRWIEVSGVKRGEAPWSTLEKAGEYLDRMRRELTVEERGKIVRAIAAGDRIGATSMYISITECGLTEAQDFIKARTAELHVDNPEKFMQKHPRKHES